MKARWATAVGALVLFGLFAAADEQPPARLDPPRPALPQPGSPTAPPPPAFSSPFPAAPAPADPPPRRKRIPERIRERIKNLFHIGGW